jgi:hypothetical protein
MDTQYQTEIQITLEPHYQTVIPRVFVKLNNEQRSMVLKDTETVTFDLMLDVGQHQLSVWFENKENSDSTTAVEIKDIAFQGLTLNRVKWAGNYTPVYPEPWATEQRQQGIVLPEVIPGGHYLGWLGTYTLDFTVPSFTWLHQIENLGWLYTD